MMQPHGTDGTGRRALLGEAGFRSLLDRLPDAIVAIQPDLTVAYANAAAHRLFHPARLTEGDPLPASPFHDLADITSTLFGRDFDSQENVMQAKGRQFRVTGIPAPDRLFAALVFSAEVMSDAAERARGEFVANAAHELLTPLTGIVSAAHVLESGAKDVPEIRDRFLAHITRECQRLARSARGLLTLARSQAGEDPPRPEVVPLRELLDHVIDGFSDPAAMTVDCADDVTVFVDADLAETALANVIGNAARHSTDGRVDVSVDASNTDVGIVVVSAAPPMSPEDVQRFQQRFRTGGGRDGGGFGLGISIASEAAKALDGSLTFDARDGQSRARLTFPAGAP